MIQTTRYLKNVILLSILFSWSGSSISTEYQYSLLSRYQISDNITQNVDGESGNSLLLGVDFSFQSDQYSSWEFDLSGNYSTTDYSLSNLAREESKSLRGIYLYRPKESNFRFLTLADISQVPRNRFQTQEVNNLRDTGLLAVKPSYFVSINPNDKINMSYTGVNFDIEAASEIATNQDNSRMVDEYSISYEKQVNPTNVMSIVAQEKNTDFDEGLAQGAVDFDQEDLFLQWVVNSRINSIQIELGKSKVRDALGQELDGNLALVSLFRRLNRIQTIELVYSEGFDSFFGINLATETINVNVQSNDLARAQRIRERSLAYVYNAATFQFSMNIFKRDAKDAFGDNRDQQSGGNFRAVYPLSLLSRNLTNADLALSYRHTENDFNTNLSTVDTSKVDILSLRFSHAVNSGFTYFIELNEREAEQEDFALLGLSNNSQSINLGFSYTDRGKF